MGWFIDEELLAQANLEEVYASNTHVLIAGKLLMLRSEATMIKTASRFDMALVERHVLARLPAANLVDRQRLMLLFLKAMPVHRKLILCALVAVYLGMALWQVLRFL